MNTFSATEYDIAFWTGYYGDDGDYFQWASNKAYLDMNRTMTFSQSNKNEKDIAKERKEWRNAGTEIIRKRFKELNNDFDVWHQQACEGLISFYNEGNKASLTYGQAQKWLNMTLKYLWLLYRVGQLCSNDAQTIKKYEKFLHVPLDSYILRYVARQNKNKSTPFAEKISDNGVNQKIALNTAWSKITDYSAYKTYQKTLRDHIRGFDCPLEWELVHWHRALKYYG